MLKIKMSVSESPNGQKQWRVFFSQMSPKCRSIYRNIHRLVHIIWILDDCSTQLFQPKENKYENPWHVSRRYHAHTCFSGGNTTKYSFSIYLFANESETKKYLESWFCKWFAWRNVTRSFKQSNRDLWASSFNCCFERLELLTRGYHLYLSDRWLNFRIRN